MNKPTPPKHPVTNTPEYKPPKHFSPYGLKRLKPIYDNEIITRALDIATKHIDADDAIAEVAEKAGIPKSQAAQAIFAATGMTELEFSKQVESAIAGVVHRFSGELEGIIHQLPAKHKVNAFINLTNQHNLLASRNAQADAHLAKNKSITTSTGQSKDDMVNALIKKGPDDAIDITPEPSPVNNFTTPYTTSTPPPKSLNTVTNSRSPSPTPGCSPTIYKRKPYRTPSLNHGNSTPESSLTADNHDPHPYRHPLYRQQNLLLYPTPQTQHTIPLHPTMATRSPYPRRHYPRLHNHHMRHTRRP